MPLLIDGYNLLWAIQKLPDTSDSINDIKLCRLIDRYLVVTKQTGQMVFDGIGPPEKNAFDNFTKLDIIFTGRRTDADTVIEDKIKINTAPKRLTVVSSDNRIRDAARRRKAISLKSEEFWSTIHKALARKQKTSEPTQKQIGLDESETKRWMDLFGIEQ